MNDKPTIATLTRPDYQVCVYARSGGGFELTCDDFVANMWSEEYGTLSVALARMAAVAACAETGWQLGFANGPSVFGALAKTFLNQSIDSDGDVTATPFAIRDAKSALTLARIDAYAIGEEIGADLDYAIEHLDGILARIARGETGEPRDI